MAAAARRTAMTPTFNPHRAAPNEYPSRYGIDLRQRRRAFGRPPYIDEYRRRPGSLLDRLEAIVRGSGLGWVARAQIDLDTATLRSEFTAHLAAVDGGRWLLDGAHVVQRVAAGSKEIRIGETHPAARLLGRAWPG